MRYLHEQAPALKQEQEFASINKGVIHLFFIQNRYLSSFWWSRDIFLDIAFCFAADWTVPSALTPVWAYTLESFSCKGTLMIGKSREWASSLRGLFFLFKDEDPVPFVTHCSSSPSFDHDELCEIANNREKEREKDMTKRKGKVWWN